MNKIYVMSDAGKFLNRANKRANYSNHFSALSREWTRHTPLLLWTLRIPVYRMNADSDSAPSPRVSNVVPEISRRPNSYFPNSYSNHDHTHAAWTRMQRHLCAPRSPYPPQETRGPVECSVSDQITERVKGWSELPARERRDKKGGSALQHHVSHHLAAWAKRPLGFTVEFCADAARVTQGDHELILSFPLRSLSWSQ